MTAGSRGCSQALFTTPAYLGGCSCLCMCASNDLSETLTLSASLCVLVGAG